jgi:ABC-type lipoprotein release transport system permease subunit
MALFNIAYNGFKKYRKRRKNLTIVLVGAFLLIFFFSSLFATIHRNLWNYWVKDLIGGNIIASNAVKTFDVYSPPKPDNFISYQKFLRENPGLAAKVTPQLRAGALLENKATNDSNSCIITGLDLKKQRRLNDYLQISEGRYFKPGKKEIVLAESVALNIKAKIGEQIIVYIITKDGYPNFDLLTVVGFVKRQSAAMNVGEYIAYMAIDKVRELMMTDDDAVSELLYVNQGSHNIIGLHGPYKMYSGMSAISIVRSLSLAFSFLEIIIFLLIFSLAISSIYHNVILMVTERYSEIGVYLTYGAKPAWVRKIFLLELMLYAFYCSILGGIFSWGLIYGINSLGIYPIDLATEILLATNHFTITINGTMFAVSFVILLILVILGSLRPIWQATSSQQVIGLFKKKINKTAA